MYNIYSKKNSSRNEKDKTYRKGSIKNMKKYRMTNYRIR